MARLLIVEDHPELASLMVAAAQSRGHEATAVHTGEAALALVRPEAFAAAVVDLLLPDMRGSVVLAALRDQGIPSVAISGVFKGDRFAREATEVHGARAFFEKPFELPHLLGFIEQSCGLVGPAPTPASAEEADADEVVVFEDASFMELDDEPGFSVTEEDDEPLFSAEPPSPPVIQGQALVEEAQDPLSDERPPAAAPPPPAPPPPYADSTPSYVRETPITLRTVELAGLVDLTTLEAQDAREQRDLAALGAENAGLPEKRTSDDEPTRATAMSAEDLRALEALSEDEPTRPTAMSAEDLRALEALSEDEAPAQPVAATAPPVAEPPVAEPSQLRETRPIASAVSTEELQALEALGPATEPPQPEEPRPVAAAAPLEAFQALEALGSATEPPPPEEPRPVAAAVSTEDLQSLEALGDDVPDSEAPPAPATPPERATDSEPEPGLALPFGEREKVWSKTPSAAPRTPRAPPAWSLSGDLKDTSVPRLLNAYYEARHSGELKLRQGSTQKVIYFEAGRPVYAASNLAPERFLRFCVRRGVVPEARAQEALALAREQNLRSSEALTRLGLLDAPRRKQVLEDLVKEVLWSTFTWTEGAYGFSALRPPSAGRVALSVFPGDLILEGIQRAEPLVVLRQRMPRTRRLFPSAAPPYGLHELKLKNQQALLLAYADGSKTVDDLLTLSDLPEREGLATLRGLELLGVLEERREEPGNRRRISFGV